MRAPRARPAARKPTVPKLTPNTGTSVCAYSRSALRIVPSPPSTRQRSGDPSRSASGSSPSPTSPCLRAPRRARTGGSRPRARPRPRRRPPPRSARAGCGCRRPRSAPRAPPRRSARSWFDRPRSRPPGRGDARPPATAWTKVSRFPFGPGRPDDANARTPSPASSIARRRREQRLAAIGRVADHARARPALAELELRLDHRQQRAAGRQAAGDRGHHLGQRDERDVDRRQPRPVGKLVGGRARARCCARSRSPGDRFAGPSRVGRGRRRVRSLLRRRAASRQSVKPPVEAPTSRQSSPATSIASASSAFSSLIPPRETNRGSSLRSSSASSATSWLGFSASGPSRPIRTRPARTDSAALVRDGARPRSASNASIRCRLIRAR